MNIAFDDMARLMALRERFFACIDDILKNGDGHKSYEGAMRVSVRLPSIFERQEPPTVEIEWFCYLIPETGRSRVWRGRTLSEAIAVAEAAADELCFSYEMDRFASLDYPTGDDDPGIAA